MLHELLHGDCAPPLLPHVNFDEWQYNTVRSPPDCNLSRLWLKYLHETDAGNLDICRLGLTRGKQDAPSIVFAMTLCPQDKEALRTLVIVMVNVRH